MIRANLLPRPNERFAMFGLRIDADHVRQASYGLALVAAVVSLTFGVQRARIVRVEDAIARANEIIVRRSAERATARIDALDVARYQEIDRETTAFRRTGANVAIAIAGVGNRVPAGVWLDTIDRDSSGYVVTGGSRRVADVGRTMLAFTTLPSFARSELRSIDGRGAVAGEIRFEAHLSTSLEGAR